MNNFMGNDVVANVDEIRELRYFRQWAVDTALIMNKNVVDNTFSNSTDNTADIVLSTAKRLENFVYGAI